MYSIWAYTQQRISPYFLSYSLQPSICLKYKKSLKKYFFIKHFPMFVFQSLKKETS